MKMKDRNEQLKATIGAQPAKQVIEEVANIPAENAVNRQGYSAYSIDTELYLLSLLNTTKLELQFYRSSSEVIESLRDTINRIALKDPYFVAQCIVWSRCMGEGLRSVNHLAAALLAPFVSNTEWGKRFYGLFDKKNQKGGCIYRLDDMSEIKDAFSTFNKTVLTNAMKKGFAATIENSTAYTLCKYKKTVRDISNLVHPKTTKCNAFIEQNGKKINVLTAIMRGINISADTWETANSEAGQIVADAIRNGKLSEDKAAEVLKEAKNDNWESLLKEGKLGILAAIRNLRNILIGNRDSVVDMVCNLIENGTKIKEGKIMPYQFEYAADSIQELDPSVNTRRVLKSLEKGMTEALPNLRDLCKGKNLVAMDVSGSMTFNCKGGHGSCIDKAAIMGALLAKATDADIILFSSNAFYMSYSPDDSLFAISDKIKNQTHGSTNIASVFDNIRRKKAMYDRIFILSDNEANRGTVSASYKKYITEVCSPYIYSIDLAAYGTVPIKNTGKVNYFFGYGYSCFDSMARTEFHPKEHIDEVRKVII